MDANIPRNQFGHKKTRTDFRDLINEQQKVRAIKKATAKNTVAPHSASLFYQVNFVLRNCQRIISES